MAPDPFESVLANILRKNIPDIGDIKQHRSETGVDFVAQHPSGSLVGEIKQSKSASIESVIGQLAPSVLRTLRRIGTAEPTVPFVLAVVPRVGPKTKREVERFMTENAPNFGWGLSDATGALRIVIPMLNIDIDEGGSAVDGSRWRSRGSMRLFSDLNRWMLKILLLADAPPEFWEGPRAPIATATELHRVARVSVQKAHQFYHAFEKAGFLVRTQKGLAIVRRKSLMDTWFHNERARRSNVVPVRSIFGQPSNLQEIICRKGIRENLLVCGFEACRVLQILHAPVIRSEVYVVGNLNTAMDVLELEPCDEREAHLYLRKAEFPRSILRGRLVRDSIPVVDVLQAALDVCDQAARGIEQADYIVNHILGWRED